jgi:hypothetical protein
MLSAASEGEAVDAGELSVAASQLTDCLRYARSQIVDLNFRAREGPCEASIVLREVAYRVVRPNDCGRHHRCRGGDSCDY